MPYADRQQQLTYMRKYMKRKRMADRIERLKNRKQRLLKQYEEDPLMRLLCEEEKVGSWIDGEIERLQGLLKNEPNSPVLGGTRKPG